MTLIDCPGCRIPTSIKESLERYVDERIKPGGFLVAALSNNFVQAADRADPESLGSIREIAVHIYSCLPANCWGSLGRVGDWLEVGT